MRGPSVALWLFLALRTGEAPPPGSGSRRRAGGLELSNAPGQSPGGWKVCPEPVFHG